MLDAVIDRLRCPVCHGPLAAAAGGTALSCARGHHFDIARQGYVSLLTGRGAPGTADTAAMVAARDRFLREGHYEPLTRLLTELTGPYAGPEPPVLAEAGAGTGHYLARSVAACPGSAGIALDVSKHALRRAARAHARIGAVLADVWRPLPLMDDSVDVLLNIFAPRNSAEFARILKPGGGLLVVTPGPGHLGELVDRLGLLTVAPDKDLRTADTLGRHFALVAESTVTAGLSLSHAAAEAAVGMGPSAWHVDLETARRKIAELPEPVAVRAAFRITTWIVA
ncbi:MAG TPA: methyltransferase domain-containing protein [Thermopolyspora sp.]